MNKLLTIIQLIIGVIVIFFALVIMWQSLVAIFPDLNQILSITLPFRVSGMNKWLQLILSIFILQVVVVYTKKIFDSLSVKSK